MQVEALGEGLDTVGEPVERVGELDRLRGGADCVESARLVRVGNRTGIVRQSHASAVGKAILAALPPAEFE